jgi:HK97 family phage major capsid protein
MNELLARREAIANEIEELLEKDVFTTEEEARYEALEKEDESILKKIERVKAQDARKASMNKSQSDGIRPDPDASSGVVVTKDAGDKPFQSLEEQVGAIRSTILNRAVSDDRLARLAYNDDWTFRAAGTGSVEGTGAYGGFLLDSEVAAGLIQRMYENNQVLSRCTRRTITTNSASLDLRAIDEASRADGSRFGGIRAYWKAELAQMTSSRPKFNLVTFTPEKLTALYYASDEILEDVPMLTQEIDSMFRQEIAFKLQDGIINGDGSGKPLGVINAGCTTTITATSGQGSSTFIYDNVTDMLTSLLEAVPGSAVWFVNQSVFPQLYEMSLAVGTGGAPIMLPPGGASGSPYNQLMGRPVIPIEQCQALGTAGDVILADMSQYYIVDKGGVNTASSIHLKFDYNQTAFKWTYRVDGRPIWKSGLTSYKGSLTLSPFLILNSTRT